MSGDGIISGLIIGIVTITLFWVIGVVLNFSRPRRNGLVFPLVFSVMFLVAVNQFAY